MQVTLPEKLEQLILGDFEPYLNAKDYTGNTTLPNPTVAFNIIKNWAKKREAAIQYESQARTLNLFYLLPLDKDTTQHYSAFNREYFFEVKQ